MYQLTTNLNIPDFPQGACVQYFENLDDLLNEIRNSLMQCPDMKLIIEVNPNRTRQ